MAALIALIVALALSGEARADELAYRGCVTGNPDLGPSGSGACALIPHPVLEAPISVAVSPDGESLYTAVEGDSALTVFARDPQTGGLTYRGCITGNTRLGGGGGCRLIPGANRYAEGTGLAGAQDVVVSPDGKSLYAIGYDTVGRFDRNPNTGALTYRGCITGDTQVPPSGRGDCVHLRTASLGGYDSGLGGLVGGAVSPDGSSLYVISPDNGDSSQDADVARFHRNPTTGAIAYRGCISGNRFLGPSGTDACEVIPSASKDAIDSGLAPVSLSLSPDGKSLYTGSVRSCDNYDCYGSSGVARFDRDPTTGALTYEGCVTGDKRSGPSGSGACAAIPSATKDGSYSGLDGHALVSSADNKTLYAGGGAILARLERNPASGALTYMGCITGDKKAGPKGTGTCDTIPTATKDGSHSGLNAYALGASPDGKTIYAGGLGDVARLSRDPATGALKFRDCVTGSRLSGRSGTGACTAIPSATKGGENSGLGRGIPMLAPSPDGTSLYSSSCCQIAQFGFAPSTRIKKSRTRGHKAVFKFSAGASSTFECKLKGKHVKKKLHHWRRCGSDGFQRKGRQDYSGLRSGRKVFKVRATDTAGDTDPTPARHRWKVR